MGHRQDGLRGWRVARRRMLDRMLGGLAALLVITAATTPRLEAQTRGDLRAVHEATVFAAEMEAESARQLAALEARAAAAASVAAASRP